MDNKEYTPEQWEIRPWGDKGDVAIAQVGYMPHANVFPRGWRTSPTKEEKLRAKNDALRIMTCVNACVGIPTKLLEQGVVKEMKEALMECVNVLESQIEEGEDPWYADYVKDARAVLTKLGR